MMSARPSSACAVDGRSLAVPLLPSLRHNQPLAPRPLTSSDGTDAHSCSSASSSASAEHLRLPELRPPPHDVNGSARHRGAPHGNAAYVNDAAGSKSRRPWSNFLSSPKQPNRPDFSTGHRRNAEDAVGGASPAAGRGRRRGGVALELELVVARDSAGREHAAGVARVRALFAAGPWDGGSVVGEVTGHPGGARRGCCTWTRARGRARAYVSIASGRQLLQTPTYVVWASLGTPPQHLLLTVDTSNNAAWIPCAVCDGCPASSAPPFNPSASVSYHQSAPVKVTPTPTTSQPRLILPPPPLAHAVLSHPLGAKEVSMGFLLVRSRGVRRDGLPAVGPRAASRGAVAEALARCCRCLPAPDSLCAQRTSSGGRAWQASNRSGGLVAGTAFARGPVERLRRSRDVLVKENKEFKVDWKRVGITSSFGFAFVGPVGHYWVLQRWTLAT